MTAEGESEKSSPSAAFLGQKRVEPRWLAECAQRASTYTSLASRERISMSPNVGEAG